MTYLIVMSAATTTDKTIDFDHDSGFLLSPSFPYPIATNENRASVALTLTDQFRKSIVDNITAEMASHGVTISNLQFLDLTVQWVQKGSHTYYVFPVVPLTADEYTANITWKVQFESDKLLSESPIPVWVVVVFKLILQAVVIGLIAYWIIQALKDWGQSMTTKTTQTDQYEWVLNPSTGQYEWKLVSSEKKTEPDPLGIIPIVIGLVVAVIVVAWLFLGRRKR